MKHIIHEHPSDSGEFDHSNVVDFVASEAGQWFFNSKPSVMSLSLNNKPISFQEEGVVISFEHQNNSMVSLFFIFRQDSCMS